MKREYKIHPNNIAVWPGSVSHILLWMLLVDRYDVGRFWAVLGYGFLLSTLVLWVYRLWYADMIDIFKPLKGKHEDNR